MSDNVLLPALGESVTEGTVTRWLKKVGDTVAIDEPLVEISTDKVDTEIPSPFAGVLEQILVQADETAQVGAALAVIGSGGSASAPAETPVAAPVAAPEPVAAPVVIPEPVAVVAPPVAAPVIAPVVAPVVVAAPVAPVVASAPVHASDAGYVTPLVRKLASENGIDLSSVSGTGVGGRIRKDDVIAAATGAIDTIVTSSVAPVVEVSALRGQTEPMSRLRKVLAERAVASMQQSAQLTTVVEVDVTKVAALRSRVQADFTARAGVKLNFMPFFILAAAEGLKAHPKLNASISGENVVYHPTENISFAVDSERGLLTPVIREAGKIATCAEVEREESQRKLSWMRGGW